MVKKEESSALSEMIFSVGEYLELLNAALSKFKAKVTGEIVELKFDKAGHVYFRIKDPASGAVLDCIIWKFKYHLCSVKLVVGMDVILIGEPKIYAPFGKLSFIADTVSLKGEGALKKAYDELKDKLEQEGLFTEERKKPLPEYPTVVGVVTSKQGAVINDLLSNLGRYGFKVQLIDSRVEGQEAVEDLLNAIKTFRHKKIDLLVVMRGGGSLESLQAFNNEVLVRAIADFPVPVIAAIGHDKDVPLMALVADASCSTPTAAAQLISQSWQGAPLKISRGEKYIFSKFTTLLFSQRQQLWKFFSASFDNLSAIFQRFSDSEHQLQQHLALIKQAINSQKKQSLLLAQKINERFIWQLSSTERQMQFLEQNIKAHDPAKNLKLGYCLARSQGVLIKSVKAIKPFQEFDLQLQDGVVISEAKAVKNN